MIQNVSPIEKEFLIKTVVQNEQPVRFHGLSTAGIGLITTMDRSAMCVTLLNTCDNERFSVCEHITGYFDCHGKTYAFETTVRNSSQNQMSIDAPDKLLRSLQRKYVRVRRPRDIQVRFHLSNEDIKLDYPVCPEYIGVDETCNNPVYSGKKLPDMLGLFRNEITGKCTQYTILMFRTKKPDHFEEELISKTGKVLFIPSTGSGLPKKDPYPEGRIITEKLEESFEDPNYFIEGSRFEKLLENKKKMGISSEIWCPIVYYQYVVGYIYVVNQSGDSFDISMVDYVWDFSRILATQLKQTGYFTKESAMASVPGHTPQILDMSPGGMLISIPKNEIRTQIKEGSAFSVEILLEKKKVSCTAKVCRRYEESESVSYGTTFLNLSPADLMALYEFLYRRPYTNDDPLAYEQTESTPG